MKPKFSIEDMGNAFDVLCDMKENGYPVMVDSEIERILNAKVEPTAEILKAELEQFCERVNLWNCDNMALPSFWCMDMMNRIEGLKSLIGQKNDGLA